MNQEKIGKFIAKKRKEKNMTQADLHLNLMLQIEQFHIGKMEEDYLMFLFLNLYVKYLIYH